MSIAAEDFARDAVLPASARQMANAIRALSMDAVERAKSGHPGMPMGMADVATVLFTRFLKFDASDPDWPDRDRLVLSAGHGSMLLYSLLHLSGYADMTKDELQSFRQLGARTAGHPEYGHAGGIEMTTGPLAQGIATAVGMALAERLHNARFGDALVSHFTYVIAGDGCLMEGLSHEAIDLAGHLKLSRLIVLFDDNGISIDGSTSLSTSMDQPARFRAAGWQVCRIDGHDPAEIDAAIDAARDSDRPSLIACRTIIGFGSPARQGTAATHGEPLGADEVAATRTALGWTAPAFDVPAPLLAAWRSVGARGNAERNEWYGRLAALKSDRRQAFERSLATGELPDVEQAVKALKRKFSAELPVLATRKASQRVLEALTAATDLLIGGSADLTGSNGTKTSHYRPVRAGEFAGNYIHYGVREHAMAAAMNGIALHGGFIPYGGTFLAFSDYSRAAIRLGALMKQRVIHVMTHDSIGLGEDGPTHQPVEHLAALRAMPNLLVFRPADAVETAEAWSRAIAEETTPSVLCLTRQGLPPLRDVHTDENLVSRGAYLIRGGLRGDEAPRDVTLLASGSEVSLAVRAADSLAAQGVRAAVVSMPCWELFERQTAPYRAEVLGEVPRIGIEAGVRMGWDRWIGPDGSFIGMQGFGASAPGADLYQHFGLTVEAIIQAALDRRED
ncbi:MAG TPA: transketolase [Woeseiaceae bacterium]|nr:transketolase [Woeseiaceae bacterium]